MKPHLLLAALLLIAIATATAPATIAHAAEPVAAPTFAGTTLEGQRYDLGARRGRVVMAVLWRSDCPVCIDKLPELRANAQGWKTAPLDLVLINLDTSKSDAQTYERLRRQVAPGEQSVYSFWQGEVQLPAAWRTADRLPHTLIIDRDGKVAATFQGRIPPGAWNQVADLLP
ncbi:MAG: redoxin [Burkholderiales bacterium PBB6]|nr:MAG: redoxin [Burkholderiales bacterium PBB6]